MLDINGKVLASSKNPHLINDNQSNRVLFQEVLMTNNVFVSDMYYSESVKNFTISYSAPVRDEEKKIIGVLSTRFDWHFIYDIIDKVKLEKDCKINLISSDGTIISSTKKKICSERQFAMVGSRGKSYRRSQGL